MTDMMVKIMVEVLDILAIATKEMRQSRFSEVVHLYVIRDSYLFRDISKEGGRNDEVGRWSTKARQNDE